MVVCPKVRFAWFWSVTIEVRVPYGYSLSLGQPNSSPMTMGTMWRRSVGRSARGLHARGYQFIRYMSEWWGHGHGFKCIFQLANGSGTYLHRVGPKSDYSALLTYTMT